MLDSFAQHQTRQAWEAEVLWRRDIVCLGVVSALAWACAREWVGMRLRRIPRACFVGPHTSFTLHHRSNGSQSEKGSVVADLWPAKQ